MRIKKFKTDQEMGEFIDAFYKKYPDYADKYSDNWVDFSVSGVTGDINFFTDGVTVE